MAAAANPAFHVTGAVHMYLTYVGISTPIYLGTCESGPQIAFQETFKDVHNDITGPSLPAQRVENGEMASIALALNRYSESTLQAMRAVVGPGNRSRWSRGKLVFGNLTIAMWLVNENFLDATTKAMYPSMEIGWYFPEVHITTREHPRLGNGVDRLLVLKGDALPSFVPGNAQLGQADPTTVAASERRFFLYSTDATSDTGIGGTGLGDFPATVRVPQ